jgi:hypothetical protein
MSQSGTFLGVIDNEVTPRFYDVRLWFYDGSIPFRQFDRRSALKGLTFAAIFYFADGSPTRSRRIICFANVSPAYRLNVTCMIDRARASHSIANHPLG